MHTAFSLLQWWVRCAIFLIEKRTYVYFWRNIWYIINMEKNIFIIKENEMFIKEDDLRSYESIRKINVIVKEDENKTEIIFIPTLYKYKKEI